MSDIKLIEYIKSFWKRSTGEIITYTEGTLMDIIQRGRTDINSLITTIESQKEKLFKAEDSHDEFVSVTFDVIKKLEKEVADQKAITELAVKGLKEIESSQYTLSSKVLITARTTLSEIERLQNEQT